MKYDRHYYIIHFNDERQMKFEDYEYLRSFWMTHAKQKLFSHVTIHDVKKKEAKGFG